jgi:type I restriction enzyme, S subunit
MSCEWPEYKIGDLTTWRSGGTPSKNVNSFWNGNIPWISAKTFRDNEISDSEIKISKEGLENGSRLAETDSILLLVRGSGLFNRLPVGIVTKPVAFNQDIKAIEVLKSKILPRFFLYWLEGNKELLNSKIEFTGIGAGKFDIDILKDISVRLPSLKEQHNISSFVKDIDDKIELNRQTNQTLEDIAQAVFKEWFVDFNFPGATGEMEESELGMIPKGWNVGKLGDVLDVKGGTTPSTKNSEYWNGENYWATPKDLSNLQTPVLLNTERKITDKGVKQINSGVLPIGTLLLSSRAPIGYLAISNVPVSINQGFIAINGTGVSNFFLLYWLKQNMDRVIARANGSTFLEISKTAFKQIEIVIPKEEVITGFSRLVMSLFEVLKNNEEQTQSLIQLRNFLLPKLMGGEFQIIINENHGKR